MTDFQKRIAAIRADAAEKAAIREAAIVQRMAEIRLGLRS